MRGSSLYKAVLKGKESKKRMNNVVIMERNKLFKSKFDACKGELKATFKILYQLLNEVHCSNFPSHTNEKTLAKSFNIFYINKVKNIKDNFKKSSITTEFKIRKQLIKYPLEHFTEVTNDDIIKRVMDLANSCNFFTQVKFRTQVTILKSHH